MSVLARAVLRAPQNLCLRSVVCRKLLTPLPSRGGSLPGPTRRNYATKKIKSTADLIPGSQQPITDEATRLDYAKTDEKMKAAVDWYRKECAGIESRATGRVTPAVLDPVRVKLPDAEKEFRLDEVATVGVRDGSTLLITIFEEDTMKHVEKALYDSQLPNIVPQRQDSRTIKIPIPKPTVESNMALVTAASRKSEDLRVQIRHLQQASVKRGNFKKFGIEFDEFQKLADRHVADVDKIINDLKKATNYNSKKK
ncbi:ribosome recycling factor domain-containing protein [Mycena alexandri]|uniref:Ribosome recycling factor domain-containing protein n=1 Tax=Mycena alexandri TaxID=1745969 RepID=A0AAD6X7T5_9AGAR|nr:ribosome recycling factor domain-containing protein [Mycena alexandri]